MARRNTHSETNLPYSYPFVKSGFREALDRECGRRGFGVALGAGRSQRCDVATAMIPKPSDEPDSGGGSGVLPLVPVRTAFGRFHLLVDGARSVVIDAGFFGERRRLLRAMAAAGIGPRDVAAIVLTHAHLDHVGNLAWLREWTGAPVYAHAAEQAHLDGTFPYRGAARVCGWMEACGRWALRYVPVPIDRVIADGEVLPFWGGLRVVHLPGHTAGHCGFFSVRHGLLFAGDLFASFGFSRHRPPAIFNSEPRLLAGSLARAAALGAAGVVPNHTFSSDWAKHAHVLQRLARATT